MCNCKDAHGNRNAQAIAIRGANVGKNHKRGRYRKFLKEEEPAGAAVHLVRCIEVGAVDLNERDCEGLDDIIGRCAADLLWGT